jgi:enamine deaminase RidA (YjgF/YER057c/UK114 family)
MLTPRSRGRGVLGFTVGACPLDENEAVVGVGDVRRQTQQVMANLTEALAAAGATLTDVLNTTVYIASGGGGAAWTRCGGKDRELSGSAGPGRVLGVGRWPGVVARE